MITETQLEQFLNLLRSKEPWRDGSRTVSKSDLDQSFDDPSALTAALRKRGFDVRRIERESDDCGPGLPIEERFTLVPNNVDAEQTVGAVGIGADEQAVRLLGLLQRAEGWWVGIDSCWALGCCELSVAIAHLKRLGYDAQVMRQEAVRESGLWHTSGHYPGVHSLPVGEYLVRILPKGSLVGLLDLTPVVEAEFRLAWARKHFLGGQWNRCNFSELDRLKNAGLLDGNGWPTNHAWWGTVATPRQLYCWRMGRTEAGVDEWESGVEIPRHQTTNGLPMRGRPMHLEPIRH